MYEEVVEFFLEAPDVEKQEFLLELTDTERRRTVLKFVHLADNNEICLNDSITRQALSLSFLSVERKLRKYKRREYLADIVDRLLP